MALYDLCCIDAPKTHESNKQIFTKAFFSRLLVDSVKMTFKCRWQLNTDQFPMKIYIWDHIILTKFICLFVDKIINKDR